MGRLLVVHSLHFTTEDHLVKTEDGHELMAQMPIAIIEMICPGNVRSSIKHVERVPRPEDVERVKATFPVGGTVEMGDFKLVKAPEPSTVVAAEDPAQA
jgi:hypothetical protein